MHDKPEATAANTSRWWVCVLPLLGVVALAAVVVLQAVRRDHLPDRTRTVGPAGGSPAGSVRLHIDFGDGVQKHFTALPWQNGMTVADVLDLAAGHPRGVRYAVDGSGESALLASIDGLQNQGAGSTARNWIYYVNGVRADRSFAVCPVKPFDTVLWTFVAYE